MSGIGGITELSGRAPNIEILNDMKKALMLRGKRRSTAFIGKSTALLYNSSSPNAFEVSEDRQPNICMRRGKQFALCIDGEQSSSAVMERYFVEGVGFVGGLKGDFALALYDGERDMLMLARDRRGKKPLYYCRKGSQIIFASEIKGLMSAFNDGIYVDKEALVSHLLSPVPSCGGAYIYTDIFEVQAGECLLLTPLGTSRFFYKTLPTARAFKSEGDKDTENAVGLYCGMGNTVEALREALIAFDYPQFDAYMPSLCNALDIAAKRGKRSLLFEDMTRRKAPTYSLEREDRLENLFGVRCCGVICKENVQDLTAIKSELWNSFSRLAGCGRSLMCELFGARRFDAVCRELYKNKKEDTERDVRILGMLIQTVEWTEANSLLIKSESRGACFDCL